MGEPRTELSGVALGPLGDTASLPAGWLLLVPMLSDGVASLRGVDDEELLLSLLELPSLPDDWLAHFENSVGDSEPSPLGSAVANAPLSSECMAASACEMRPSVGCGETPAAIAPSAARRRGNVRYRT